MESHNCVLDDQSLGLSHPCPQESPHVYCQLSPHLAHWAPGCQEWQQWVKSLGFSLRSYRWPAEALPCSARQASAPGLGPGGHHAMLSHKAVTACGGLAPAVWGPSPATGGVSKALNLDF